MALPSQPSTPSNQHLANRAAFAQASSSDPVVATYLQLVVLELALKDAVPTNHTLGHDVFTMLRNWPSISSPVNVAAQALESALARLICHRVTKQVRIVANVRADKFPDLRYVRHSQDFTTPHTPLSDCVDVQQFANQLVDELKRGGFVWP